MRESPSVEVAGERMVYLWISLRSQWNTIHSAPVRHLTLRYQVMVSAADIPRAGLTHSLWLATLWAPQGLWSLPAPELSQPFPHPAGSPLGPATSSSAARRTTGTVVVRWYPLDPKWVQQLHHCCFLKVLVLVLPNHVFWSKTWRRFGTLQESWIVGLLLQNSWVQMLAIGVHSQQVVVCIQHPPAGNNNQEGEEEDLYFQDSSTCMTLQPALGGASLPFDNLPAAYLLLTLMKLYDLGVAILEETSPLSFFITTGPVTNCFGLCPNDRVR